MNICQQSKSRFSTEATDYGSTHEQVAGDIQRGYRSNVNEVISLRGKGLFLSEFYPYLGASPDEILDYYCCGTVFAVEIKYAIKATKNVINRA